MKKKRKMYATMRKQMRLGAHVVSAGQKVELVTIQNERGDGVKIRYEGRLFFLDHIELYLPKDAMPWVKKSTLKIQPQTLENGK